MSQPADIDDFFAELDATREIALRALRDVQPVANAEDVAFYGERTEAGRDLPPAYLVRFLLVDLLAFPSLGPSEKVAWTVPIEYKGQIYIVEHRKLGIGVFAKNATASEVDAREIVARIRSSVRAASSYFDWLASRAVAQSKVNVVNHSDDLFERFRFLLGLYRSKKDEMNARKNEQVVSEENDALGNKFTKVSYPAFQLGHEAEWLALVAIDAFYSWTEHAFIHLAVLSGSAKTGHDVARLAEADWADKFKAAIGVSDPRAKKLFDSLVIMRRELRNFVAHGAFGKDGRAFTFHSNAGAVPVLLPHKAGSRRFRLVGPRLLDDDQATKLVDDFIEYLWQGPRSPARIYIQDSGLPIILPMASDGTYAEAMKSDEAMSGLVRRLHQEWDRAANMDW